jgi:hypothetical protein
MERNRRGLIYTYAVVPTLLVVILKPVIFAKDRFGFVTLRG